MRLTHNPLPITRNLVAEKHAFSSKERDTETGLSYFGARYYSSELSVWLSVDPMSDKYPSLSPYTYCSNNPVKLVDPNGEDWYENELTGDVYYNRDYRKGDERKIDGEGWKWMGKNNMFEKSDDDAINTNLDKVSGVSCRQDGVDGIASASFSGKNAEAFMRNMGYELMPSKVEIDFVEYKQMWDFGISGNPNYNYDKRELNKKVLSVTYAPQKAIPSYSVLNERKYTDKLLGPFISKTTWKEIRQYQYSNSRSAKFEDFLKRTVPPVLETISRVL